MVTAELGACEWFVYELRRSNLMDRGQLDQVVGDFLKRQPRAEPPALAHYLIEQGHLSPYQAERVLTNKAQGLVLGPYVLVDSIGAGSMGTVYKATSKTDGKVYAVKVLPRRSMWNVRLARRQVRSFGQFSHPAVVPFMDVGTSGGMHYLVWPLVEGETLDSLVQRLGRLTPEQAAAVGKQIASGLTACHENGLFHGLLKPSNVMIGADQQVTILDFGIGSLLVENEGESLVDTMSTANTLTSGLDCASPESIMEPTNRTPAGDQYSLGCTLYFCVSGRYPFAEGSAVEKMMAHQFKQPTPLKELVPDVPDKLAEVIERLMQKAPEARYRGADEVVEELQSLAGAALPPSAPLHEMAAAPPAPRATPFPPARGRGSDGAHLRSAVPPAPASAYPAQPAFPPPQLFPTPFPVPPLNAQAAYAGTAGANPSGAFANPPSPARTNPAAEAGPQAAFVMPPGFIEEQSNVRQLSPMIFAAIGTGVMVVAYFALMALNAK